jgi:uncharacterized protein YjbK
LKTALSIDNKRIESLLEKELKYELSKKDYLRLVKTLEPKVYKHLDLVNYYFDDPDLSLRKSKFGLRIRVVDGKKFFFTLKYPAKMPENFPRALKIRHEHEVPLPAKTAKSLLKGDKTIMDLNVAPVRILKKHFPKGSLSRVRPLGVIQTRRTVVPIKPKFELEIDSFKMFGKRFYELEVETSQPTKIDKQIRLLFKSHRIHYQPLTRSKLGRFLQEWKRKNRSH